MDKVKKPDKSTALLKSKSNKMMFMDLREIIREHALRYLPAKSLHRFKAVCRDWKCQISAPFLEHSQSFAFRSFSGLFCQSPDGSISFISLDPMAYGIPDPQLEFLPEPVDLLASSNGLLCCRGQTGDMAYYICNPVNQMWKKLPKPEANHGQNPALVLVFEPSLLNFVADFKLICAFPSTDIEDTYEFEIYSSTEDSWKISSEIWFGENGRKLKAGGTHVNGVVYWYTNDFVLIGFDLKKNHVNVIPSPGWYKTHTLGVMDGKLCAVHRKDLQVTASLLTNEYASTMHMHGNSKTWDIKTVPLTAGKICPSRESAGIVLAVENGMIVFPYGIEIFSKNIRTLETSMLASEAEFSMNNVYIPYVNSLVRL